MPPAIDPSAILEAVLSVWRVEGYQRATTRQIAALAGISEMTLFRRFGDKAALFRAALELEAERFTAEAMEYSGNLEADLQLIVDAYAALLDRSASIVLDFLLEAPRNPDLARIRVVPAAALGKVAMVIVRHQAEGRLRDGPPLGALLALLSPLVMAAMLKRAQPGMLPSDTSGERVKDFLLGWGTAEV
jgi:AcrR family transcriptional regulator